MSPAQPPPEPEKQPRIDPGVRRITLTLVAVALMALIGWLIQTYL